MLTLAFIILLIIYNIPTLIAVMRYDDRALKILVINVILGWTIIGWLYALCLSLSPKAENEPSTV